MRDFWDDWARFFGYEEWVWGSAADWAAAIGTGAAFILGYLLLRREIDEKRSRHADAFITDFNYVKHPLEGSWHLSTEVLNSGNHAITGATIYEFAAGGPDAIDFFGKYDTFRFKIAPGDHQKKITLLDGDPKDKKLFIEFVDVAGRKWFRSVETRKYLSRRQYNRTYWGTRFGCEPDRREIREKAGKQAFQPASEEDLARIDARNRKEAQDAKENPTPPGEGESANAAKVNLTKLSSVVRRKLRRQTKLLWRKPRKVRKNDLG